MTTQPYAQEESVECPKCKTEIQRPSPEFNEEGYMYEMVCPNKDCGVKLREHYEAVFAGISILDENGHFTEWIEGRQ